MPVVFFREQNSMTDKPFKKSCIQQGRPGILFHGKVFTSAAGRVQQVYLDIKLRISFMKRLLIVLAVIILNAPFISAKRSGPKEVKPAVYKGVKYIVVHFPDGTDQRGGFIEARDMKTGKRLRLFQVYKISYSESLESDVQDIFITKIHVRKGMLHVVNERKDRFVIDLESGIISPKDKTYTK